MTNQLKELSLRQPVGGLASSLSSNPTHSTDVHSVQSSTNPNGIQPPRGNKKKGHNNRKDGKNGNKSKDNNEKTGNSAREGKREKRKVKFPCKICTDDHLTHLCPKLAEAVRLLSQSPVVLTNPSSHNEHLAWNSSNAKNAVGGGQNQQSQDDDRLCINMVDAKIDVAIRSRDYSSKQTIPSLESPPPPPKTTLQIEKPKPRPRIPKGVLKRSTHNPNARYAQNYFIVEDLGQTPCAMSSLEVLQMCPSHRNALLSALGDLEPSGSNLFKFDVTDVKPRLPYYVAFQIHVEYSKYTIKRAIVDEGATTCVMSLVCLKALGSPTLSRSSNMLTSFDSHSFHLHDILPAFSVQLGGNTVEVEVEVVDASLDYNLLLGRNWTYAMIVVVSSVFRTLCFPHEGNIVTIDQLSFAYSSPNASLGQSIPMIDNSRSAIENVGVGMYSSLMGTFDFSTPNHQFYAMSNRLGLDSEVHSFPHVLF
jgi:hypothetical protein